jgi:hypothetical protein
VPQMRPIRFGAFLKKDGRVLKANPVIPASLNPKRYILTILINVPPFFLFICSLKSHLQINP